MSDVEPAKNLKFSGVLGSELGCEPSIGDVVTITYLGVTYQARVTDQRADYDDFGTATMRYDLETTGVVPS